MWEIRKRVSERTVPGDTSLLEEWRSKNEEWRKKVSVADAVGSENEPWGSRGWGRSSCPDYDRAKPVPCGTGFAPYYPAREGTWTGKEPLLPRLAKHSDPIAKHIIKVSSYSRKTERKQSRGTKAFTADFFLWHSSPTSFAFAARKHKSRTQK